MDLIAQKLLALGGLIFLLSCAFFIVCHGVRILGG